MSERRKDDSELVWETLRTHQDEAAGEAALQAFDRILDAFDSLLDALEESRL